MSVATAWNVDFLQSYAPSSHRALIIVNQPFSASLFRRLWNACTWRCCADGGANRLHDVFDDPEFVKRRTSRAEYLPNLIKGDLDSIRDNVKTLYASHGVPIIEDHDTESTDLMKCVSALQEREKLESQQYDIIILGGLSGRLDQTISTLSYVHKLRHTRNRVFVITDDSVGWVLDAGEHTITIDHDVLGQTCGLLPVGIESTILTTSGLRWNLTRHVSSFDGLVSTSNHLIPEEKEVKVSTSKPIWWTAEVKKLAWD